ncbi:MAG: phage major capsid protein [Afipia sp.]|nr:phage major capsid protein [Afipia sp.]
MGKILIPRARGLVAVRSDASNPAAILAELQKTFEAFKEANNKELADLKKGMGDVVQTEKVDRINAEITKLQTAIDETNALLAAARLGGSDDKVTPEKKAHAAAFEQFFRKGAENGLRDLEVKAAATTDSNPDGGYLVPDTMEQTIDRILATVSSIRSIASVISISTQTYKKLVGQGGATGGWVGERQSRSETNTPTLSELSFPAMEMYANPAATQTSLDDSRIDIASWLGSEVSQTFADMEGVAFYSGDGNNKPRGIASYTMVADSSYAWGKVGFTTSGVAAALNDSTHSGHDALTDLVYAIKQGYRTNAGFLMNRKTQAAIRKFATLGSEKMVLWQPSMQLGQPATLMGYPITDDDNVADIGANAFPIWFGDFKRAYLIVDRFGMRVLRDPYTNKPYVHFYTTKRVGGGIQNFGALKALKCST